MLKLKKSVLALMAISSSVAFAGTMGEVKPCPDVDCCMPWFVQFGTGVSWANNAKITYNKTAPDIFSWTNALNGFNSGLGTVPLYMAGIGYTVSPLLKLDASYTFRGIYKYNHHVISDSTGSPYPLLNNNKYFDLNSNSLMFSGTLFAKGLANSSFGNMLVHDMFGCGTVQPFVGGGVGVSYNTLSNFHKINDNSLIATSIMNDTTVASFAWQLNAGLNWQITERLGFDIGYRYFNAGRFNSNDYITSRISSSNNNPLYTVYKTPWIGTLSANELFFTARVAF
jgi:opacity protein-like surface antigen